MGPTALTVCASDITLHLVGPRSWTEMRATLVYETRDPFAVRVRFGSHPAGRGNIDRAAAQHHAVRSTGDAAGVEWLLGRELLHAALRHPVGTGDVRLWPTRSETDVLFLELRAPLGQALFELSRSAVASFLHDTEGLVPRGAESAVLDLDGELVDLLGGGRQGHGQGPDAGR